MPISDISLIFAACKVLNIRSMRTFNYNDMPHEVLEMASEYAIKESRSGRGLSHFRQWKRLKGKEDGEIINIMLIAHYRQSTVTIV